MRAVQKKMLSKVHAPFAELLAGPAMSPGNFFQRLFDKRPRAQLTPLILHALPHYIEELAKRLKVVCATYSDLLLHFPDPRADEILRCLTAQCDVWEKCVSSEKWLFSLFSGENTLLDPIMPALFELSGDEHIVVSAWSEWLERIELEADREKKLVETVVERVKTSRRAKKLASQAKRRCGVSDPETDDAQLATPEGTPGRMQD
jgi:hypothetical protein